MRLTSCLFLAFCCFSTAGFANASQTMMRFCYENQNYPPYLIEPENGVVSLGNSGVLTDLILHATKNVGIKAEFVHYPWKRCITLLETGQVDGIYAAIWLKKRDKWGVFPKQNGKPDSRFHLWQVKYNIYTLKDTELTWDGEQFTGVKTGLAAPLGYVAEEKLEQLKVKAAHTYLPKDGMRLVGMGRLDGYVVESAIGDHLQHSIPEARDVISLGEPFMLADWYVPLSHAWVKEYPELSEKFWQALADARDQYGPTLYQKYSYMASE